MSIKEQNIKQSFGKLVVISLSSTLIFSIFFAFNPAIDIGFSQLFWSEENGFFLKHNPLIEAISNNIYLLVIAYLLITVVVSRQRRNVGKHYSLAPFSYSVVTLLLGPGLIVNMILKEFWGRARPQAIEEFNGSNFFTPAWQLADQCSTNCSFVSGHASAAFVFYSLCLLIFYQRKHFSLSVLLITLFGLVIGGIRIIEGKHFLSDIIIVGHLIWLSSLFCYYLFFLAKR